MIHAIAQSRQTISEIVQRRILTRGMGPCSIHDVDVCVRLRKNA